MARRFLPFLAAALVLDLGAFAGTAYAYFTASGSGSGSGTVETLQAVAIVSPTLSPSDVLYPGRTADVTLTLTNPNNHAVTVTTVLAYSTISATWGKGTCSGTGGVTFTDQTGLTDKTIPAHTTKSFHFPTAASMSSASSTTGCQTATFFIPVTVTVKT
ncbi:MAG: hypothetical protein ACRD6W_13595 [Nitrososphaerales archaeon]